MRTTKQVLESHQEASETLNINKLMSDYEKDAILVSLEGIIVGKEAIQRDFVERRINKPGGLVSFEKMVFEGDFVLIEWSVKTGNATYPSGVRVLLIQDGLIQRQADWYPGAARG